MTRSTFPQSVSRVLIIVVFMRYRHLPY